MADINRKNLESLYKTGNACSDKQKIEKKILNVFIGDLSDGFSGISLPELRLNKSENEEEYTSRKAKLFQALYDYFNHIYPDTGFEDAEAYDKLGKFFEHMWTNFTPEPDKDILRYIKTSIKHIFSKYDRTEEKDQGIEDKIKKYKRTFESARPELEFDVQKIEHQQFLADLLTENYLSRHDNVDSVKRNKFYLKRIKEAARVARISVESIEYEDPESTKTKIDDLEVIKLNQKESSSHEKMYKNLFDEIQKLFSKSQDRTGNFTKKYLSSLITIRLIREKNKLDDLDVLFFDVMNEYEFSDKELLIELRHDWDTKSKFPKQKEIAARFIRKGTGKERAGDDASRYLKPYVVLMKKYL